MPRIIKKPLNTEQFNDAKAWDLPSVDDEFQDDPNKTNAFNRTRTWRYEAPDEPAEEDLKPLTAEDIEDIRQSAYEEGFQLGKDDGFQKGYEEGLESGTTQGIQQGSEQGLASADAQIKEQLDNLTAQWQALIEGVAEPLRHIDKEVEKELMMLSVKLAEAIVFKHVSDDKEVLIQALSEGLKVLPINDSLVSFHLHPDDIAIVYDHFGSEKVAQNNWKLVESPNLQRGGCEIITENHSVDVSIESRCKQIFERFLSEQGIGNDPRLD